MRLTLFQLDRAMPSIVWRINSDGMKHRWGPERGEPHFDTWSKGICMVWGDAEVYCSSVTGKLPPPPPIAPDLLPLRQRKPLTRPHLLAPGLDIVALSKARLANPKTRFSSVSQKVWFGADRHLGWSSIHTHTHNINTFIHTRIAKCHCIVVVFSLSLL